MGEDILLLLAGVVVGGMNSIAGGGMLFGFPIMLATGMPAITANATSHIVLLPGQVGAIIGFRKYLKKVSKVYLWLLIPLIVGAAIGSFALRQTSADNFERLIPILLVFAVGLFALQPTLHHHFHKHLISDTKGRKALFLIALSLLPIAMYGGYFGVGFGFVLLSFLSFSKIHDLHKINALKNVGTLIISIVTSAVLLTSGLIDWESALFMAIGCGLGGYLGAHVAQKFSSHAIRLFILFVGVVSVVFLFFKTY